MFLRPPQIAFKTKIQMYRYTLGYHIYIYITYTIIYTCCILLSFQTILKLLYPRNTEMFTFQLILATACKLQEFYKSLFPDPVNILK